MYPKRHAASTSRGATRRAIVVAGCVVAGLLAPATAHAAPDVTLGLSLGGGSTVSVGASGHGQLSITNTNPAGDGTITLADVTLVPGCGATQIYPGSCPSAKKDPDVFDIAPDAYGIAGSCWNMHFSVAVVDAETGKVRFTPDAPVTAAAAAWASCTIDFSYTVANRPVNDVDVTSPGERQTNLIAYGRLGYSLNPGLDYDAEKRMAVTVERDTPTLVARALPPTANPGDAIYATGELQDATNPTGSLRFSLFEPNAGCSGTPILTHTVDVDANGLRQSSSFTPSVIGGYKWQVEYLADDDHNGVTVCSGNLTDVKAPIAPPPPPPVVPPPPPPPPPAGPIGPGGTGGTGATGAIGTEAGRTTTPGATVQRIKLDSFTLTRRTFARAAKTTALTATAAATRKPVRRTAKGTTIKYRLSAPATVTMLVERVTVGRRSGTKCVKTTKRNKAKKRCTLYTKVSTIKRTHTSAGAKKVAFSGRAGRKTLAVGSYRIRATAAAGAATKSVQRIAKFKIVKR